VKIKPDGVNIHIDDKLFVVNSSVFIPCINTVTAMTQAKAEARAKGMDINSSVAVERGCWGIRIWRIV
jgi:hypothetical protein